MDGNLCCMFPFIFAHVFMTSLKASTRKPKMHTAVSLDRLITSSRYQATPFSAFSVLWPHSSMFQLLRKENWWKLVYHSACKAISLVPAVGLWTGCACVCVCVCLSYFLQLDCGQKGCVINYVKYIGHAFCVTARLRTAQGLVLVDRLNSAQSISPGLIPDRHEG